MEEPKLSRKQKRVAIKAYLDSGLSIRKTAEKVGVDPKTVLKWKHATALEPETATEMGSTGVIISDELQDQVLEDWRNRETVPTTIAQLAMKNNISKAIVLEIIRSSRNTARTPKNLKMFEEIMQVNPGISLRQLARQLSISKSTATRMMKDFRSGIRGGTQATSETDPLRSVTTSEIGDFNNLVSDSDDFASIPESGPSEFLGSNANDDDDDQVRGGGGGTPLNCFLCNTLNGNGLDFNLSSPATGTTTTPVPAEVEQSTWVICFLKNILQMSNEDLWNVMREMEGMNPNEWGISVCTSPDCRGTVEKALTLWMEVKKLEAELRKRRQEILAMIQSCSKRKRRKRKEKRDESDQALVNDRVLEVVKRGKRQRKRATEVETKTNEVQEDPGGYVVKVEPGLVQFNDNDPDDDWFKHVNFESDMGQGLDGSDSQVKIEPELRQSRSTSTSRRKRKEQQIGRRGRSASKLKSKSALVKRRKVDRDRSTEIKEQAQPQVVDPSDEMIYSCQFCPHLGKMDINKFIAHIAFHSARPNKCTECSTHFPANVNDELVQKHWEERHTDSQSIAPKLIQVPSREAVGKIWLCSRSECMMTFERAEERGQHELAAHGNESTEAQIICTICSSPNSPKFYNSTELRLHKALVHPDEAMLSCCYCDSQFAVQSEVANVKFLNVDLLKKHISEEHPERLCKARGGEPGSARFLQTCLVCGVVFNSRNYSQLDTHIFREHGQRLYETYSCQICAKKMRFADVWIHAKMSHWPDAPRPYVCQFCGKGFRRAQNWLDHEQIHKNKETRPFQCELCGSSFAVKTYLYIHLRVTHQHRPSPSALRKRQSRKNSSTEVPATIYEHLKTFGMEAGPNLQIQNFTGVAGQL